MRHIKYPNPFFPTPNAEPPEQRELRFKKRVSQITVLILALISGVWTFEGGYLNNLRVGGESFTTVMSAGLLAIGVTAGIMTAWWVMMSVIPTLRSPRRIAAGLLLILSLQCWMLAVSSLNNLVAQSAAAALTTHMERTAAGYAAAVDGSQRTALSIKPFLGIIEGEANGRCAQAEAEISRGALSGSPGRGATSGMLELLCVQSTAVAETLAAAIGDAEARALEADRLLQRLDRDIHDHELTIFEREAAFLTGLGKLDAWLRRSDAGDLTQTLTVAHEAMAASIAPPSLASGSFGERQRGLIEDLRASVDNTGAVYRDVVQRLESGAVPPPTDVRISLPAAIWRSRLDHLPQIAAAIGIDFFQLFLVLGFLLGESGQRPVPARRPRPPWPYSRTSRTIYQKGPPHD